MQEFVVGTTTSQHSKDCIKLHRTVLVLLKIKIQKDSKNPSSQTPSNPNHPHKSKSSPSPLPVNKSNNKAHRQGTKLIPFRTTCT